jgi:hypothetical protein
LPLRKPINDASAKESKRKGAKDPSTKSPAKSDFFANIFGGPSEAAQKDNTPDTKAEDLRDKELKFAKGAVKAAQRRAKDERAAVRARAEARERQKIQKNLAKEAERARRRRANKEQAAEEARAKVRQLDNPRGSSSNKNIFSLFDNTEPGQPIVPIACAK